ncbi:MAG: nitrogenase iron-molybdenum cofactor biosynthesis protein NifN, partial [Sulfurimonas sp.]
MSIGASMQVAAKVLLEKNPNISHHHFDHLLGQENSDNFVAALMKIRQTQPKPSIKRWRGRLQDAML